MLELINTIIGSVVIKIILNLNSVVFHNISKAKAQVATSQHTADFTRFYF